MNYGIYTHTNRLKFSKHSKEFIGILCGVFDGDGITDIRNDQDLGNNWVIVLINDLIEIIFKTKSKIFYFLR